VPVVLCFYISTGTQPSFKALQSLLKAKAIRSPFTFRQFFFFFLPALVVVLTGLALYFIRGPLFDLNSLDSPGHEWGLVQLGEDYYFRVSLVEVSERDEKGEAWDQLGEAAPDLYYQVVWRNTLVFESSVKKNTLLAAWSKSEVDLVGAALSGENISSDLVVAGARLNIIENETVQIKVYESDTLSRDELVGSFRLATDKLPLGTGSWNSTDDSGNSGSLRRVEYEVFPIETR